MSEDGIRVELRMIVSHEADQRYDSNGVDLVQIRGHAVDSQHDNPEVVVRFAGQQRAQLLRWCKPGKHLSVVGQLEVKTWSASNGMMRVALLVEARDIHPLDPDEVDHSRAGVYTALGRISTQLEPPRVSATSTKAARAGQMRRMLEGADG